MNNAVLSIVVFKCGREEFGLPVEVIREVILKGEIIPLPHVPDFVCGIIHLRGHLIAVIDLAEKLGIQKEISQRFVIITFIRGMVVGFVVDAVIGLAKLAQNNLVPTPSVALPVDDGYVKNIGDINGRIIPILDLGEIVSQDEIDHIHRVKREEEKIG